MKPSNSNPTLNPTIDNILKQRRIIVTCGTGGVGKTTLSAAMAMRATLLGKRTVVVTIDPAKRLATSLGVNPLSDQPTDLTPALKEICERHQIPVSSLGTLAAIVPDTRKTFENFVLGLASHPATADRIMRNPIFQVFAKEFSGTNEYMALERLLALSNNPAFDCIILDTPPSRNTLAFLNAPKILAQFFEEKLIRWLVLPTNKLLSQGIKKALGILERLTGAGFMTHLFEFASALVEVQVKFSANLRKITSLLESPNVGFVMVSAAAPETSSEAAHFIRFLEENRLHFDGIALNRTLSHLEFTHDRPELEAAYSVIRSLQEREKQVLESLQKNPFPICAKLPELARDVHSLEDLFHVASALGGFSFHHTSSLANQLGSAHQSGTDV